MDVGWKMLEMGILWLRCSSVAFINFVGWGCIDTALQFDLNNN